MNKLWKINTNNVDEDEEKEGGGGGGGGGYINLFKREEQGVSIFLEDINSPFIFQILINK